MKLSCEAVAAVTVAFLATAFAVSWKDCGKSMPSVATVYFRGY